MRYFFVDKQDMNGVQYLKIKIIHKKKKNKKGFCKKTQNNNVVGCSFGFYTTKGELI